MIGCIVFSVDQCLVRLVLCWFCSGVVQYMWQWFLVRQLLRLVNCLRLFLFECVFLLLDWQVMMWLLLVISVSVWVNSVWVFLCWCGGSISISGQWFLLVVLFSWLLMVQLVVCCSGCVNGVKFCLQCILWLLVVLCNGQLLWVCRKVIGFFGQCRVFWENGRSRVCRGVLLLEVIGVGILGVRVVYCIGLVGLVLVVCFVKFEWGFDLLEILKCLGQRFFLEIQENLYVSFVCWWCG